MRKALFLIDVEPDGRHTSLETSWAGNDVALSYLEPLRQHLERATGQPVHWNWFVRLDPQIEHTWGRIDYIRNACPRVLDRVADWQDHIGIHVHLWKWDETHRRWYNEFADPAWEAYCFRRSVDAFTRIFGFAPRSLRMGERWMSETLPAIMRASGIRYDAGIETGIPSEPVFDDPYATAPLPDFTSCPRRPWHPMPGNYRIPGGPPGLTMIPLTCSRPRWIRRHRFPFLERRRVTMNLVLHPRIVVDTLQRESSSETETPLVVVLRAADLAQPWALDNFRQTSAALASLTHCTWVSVDGAIGND